MQSARHGTQRTIAITTSIPTSIPPGSDDSARPLLFGLDERPPWPQTVVATLAHLLAIVASIATAPLLIARGLNLDAATTQYVIASALVISGIATLIQVIRIGPFGSGLLSIQGTSYAFIGALMLAGSLLSGQGLNSEQIIGVLLGSAAVGAAVTVLAGYFVERLQRVITPTVTGIAVCLLGVTLVWTAITNFRFALDSAESQPLVWAQAGVVIVAIVALSTRNNPWLRMGSITLGLLAGMAFAWSTGGLAPLPETSLAPAMPLRFLPFPLGFDLGVFLVLTPIYFVTMAEAIGDLTATSMLSKQPLQGSSYWRRIRGGVMADGLNSMLAALAGTFPNTTFSQNNGVIRLTGVACRVVGIGVGLMLIVLGALPGFSALFQSIPGGVLHSTTGLLFAMIALTGMRLLRAQANVPRAMRMLLVCSALAFALTLIPGLAADQGLNLPPALAILFGFPVASGALLALLWEWLWP
ncbi:MAG: uracil-xanthine permease family protein [Pseudomonadales bacterium]